jgi:hypothetical protein
VFFLKEIEMAFTGKATYSAGATLPELVDDVSDLVSIAAATETPLLDLLGDSARVARSTVHEWLEESQLPTRYNVSAIDDDDLTTTTNVALQPGDLLGVVGADEVMLVVAILGPQQIRVQRGYGGTTAVSDMPRPFELISGASLEGDEAGPSRTTVRSRRQNYTQIFTATVEVSGTMQAVGLHGVRDELEYQKTLRLRELLRNLERAVIEGVAPASDVAGTSQVRRTMRGIRSFIQENRFTFDDLIPGQAVLDEPLLNRLLRRVWERGAGTPDLILVSGQEKRKINEFVASNRRFYTSNETFKDMVSVYESDFGVCRVVMSRHVRPGEVFVLDSSRVQVLPLAGRSMQYKPLAARGDSEAGQLIGEYTLEFRDELAHGLLTGLAA